MKKTIKFLLLLFFTTLIDGCTLEYTNRLPPNPYDYLRSPYYYYDRFPYYRYPYYGYPYYGYPKYYHYNPYHYKPSNPKPNYHRGPRK